MKFTMPVLLFFLLPFFLFPLGAGDPVSTDGKGESGTAIPQRIVSLGPNITETLFALNREELLVGRTDYCDYPPEALDIPSVGTLTEPSLEKIVSLNPDLVIASTHVKAELLNTLEEAGISVLSVYSEEDFDGVYSLIRQVADRIGAGDEGMKLTDEMRKTVALVQEEVAGREKPVVYYVIGYGEYGDYTAGGNTFIGKMIEMAGGVNAAAELEGWRYSLEKLLVQDPDMLICSGNYGNIAEELSEAAGYRDLTAVKEGRVYTIDNNKLDRQGPRLAEGLMDLAGIIHGDDF